MFGEFSLKTRCDYSRLLFRWIDAMNGLKLYKIKEFNQGIPVVMLSLKIK
jgi:hypothetical protein